MEASTTAPLSGIRELDFARFHREYVSEQLSAGRGRLAAPDVAGVAPLTLALDDGRAYHYREHEGDLRVDPGEAGSGVTVRLAEAAFRDFGGNRNQSHPSFYRKKQHCQV